MITEPSVDPLSVDEPAVATVRQHLLITPPIVGPSDDLQDGDINLAGEQLLPRLEPMDWPTSRDLERAQQRLSAEERQDLHEEETADGSATLLLDRQNRIKLPAGSPIIARVCAVAHQGTHGHHTPTETLDRAKEEFHWEGMADTLTSSWCRKCLQCIKLSKGPRIPRPMGHQLVATHSPWRW